MAERRGGERPEAAITAAKIAVGGAVVAAIIAATATITAALLQRGNSTPTTTAPLPGSAPVTVFDAAAVERGVATILVDDYGVPAGAIEGVDCPDAERVELGNSFTCVVRLGGDDPGEKAVVITVRDEATGEYEVSRPRDR